MMFFACVACRATHCLLRLLGFGASSLPGAVALKICPDVLEWAAKNVDILAVTGTNGKTTSARMAERALQNAGHTVCLNRTGANLMPGITAALILNKSIFGKIKCSHAVIECDEAACRLVLGKIKPRVLLITNLFRDQLDRYGTVTRPRDCIAEGLRASLDTVAVINADCPLTASIATLCKNKAVYFGAELFRRAAVGSGEGDICPVCGAKLRYRGVSYASLGDYSCFCGFHRPEPALYAESTLPDGSFVLNSGSEKRLCSPALPGMYNIYNAVGVCAAGVAMGGDITCAVDAVSSFERGFGRMEEFALGKDGAKMILIKNAAATDQTLAQVGAYGGAKSIIFAVNARTADGTDISWLNDADLGRLARMKGLRRVYVCGDCRETVQKRLERENIPCQSCENYDKLIDTLREEDAFIFILPTYTAMLELREKLIRRLGGKNFWE